MKDAPEFTNPLGQPVGFPLPGWQPPPWPPSAPMTGSYTRLEPLHPDRHAATLHEATAQDVSGRLWTYLPYGPFPGLAEYRAWAEEQSRSNDPMLQAIVDLPTGRAVGVAGYLRIQPASGSIEVGHLQYSPALQRTPPATEAIWLLLQRVFELGYRRCEWKCDALNAPSRRAAQRLGFSFEGIFRQATVYRARNRDTAWYSILDREWPALDRAFRQWLDPANFDAGGGQRLSLSSLTEPLLTSRG